METNEIGVVEVTLEDHARTINFLKREAATSAVAYAARIGAELIEAKGKCEHGTWGDWLRESVGYSQRTADRLMQISREQGSLNSSPVANLEYSKVLALLALPESERADFVAEVHEVNGEEKTVADMTRRELEQAIRERNEANKQIDGLRKELAELKARPVEVAVQTDETAVKAARAEAEDARAAQKAAEEAKELICKQMKLYEAKIDELQRASDDAGDKDVAQFKLYIETALEFINKANGIRFILARREDKAEAERAQAALVKLADKIREAAA